MPQNNSYYSIQHIRLINFHNFAEAEIDIPNNGHLFLLGDNASGKTTVLDAVHYVMTAGNNMEFNSAARVAGSRKASGRRMQGVVTRFNIEVGALRPSGGISYAGIEIKGRHGRVTSVLLGLSCDSMEGKIERWGVIKECPLDEIPLIVTENGKRRPSGKNELKDSLDGKGFYGRIGGYEKELANRFFGGESTFKDVCQLLATGKAYREIVSKSSDYHELFRQLLQEPDHEIFNQVIEALRSIEASREELQSLQKKVDFLETLRKTRDEVNKHRLTSALMEWQDIDLALKETWSAHDNTAEFLVLEKGRFEGLKTQSGKLDLDLKELNSRYTRLQNSDSEGLVEKERDADIALQKIIREQNQALSKRTESYERLEAAKEALLHARSSLIKKAQDLNGKILKLGMKLSLNFSSFSNALDNLTRSETPEDEIGEIPFAEIAQKISSEQRKLDREQDRLTLDSQVVTEQKVELEEKIETKEKEGEAIPKIEGFSDIQKYCRENLLESFPLYKGLIPAVGVKGVELAALEQLIGENILATWIVSPAEADTLRKLIFQNYPNQSLAVLDSDDTDDSTDWLHRYFNYSESDPRALIIIQRSLTAAHGPNVSKFLDFKILNFRSREQRVIKDSSRLIGAELRKRALQKEIKSLKDELKICDRTLQDLKKEQNTLLQQNEMIQGSKALVDEWQIAAPNMSRDAWKLREEVRSIHTECEGNNYTCSMCEEDLANKKAKHDDLRIKLESTGLKGLDKRLKQLSKEIASKGKEKSETDVERGKVENKIEQQEKFCAKLQEDIIRYENEKKGRESVLRNLTSSVLPPAEIAAQKLDLKLPETRFLTKDILSESMRDEAVCTERINTQIRSIEGVSFSFSYDKKSNLLTDRRTQSLDDVVEGINKDNAEQRELINERTQHLFKRIVMHDLVEALQVRVRRLQSMSKRIKKLLSQREFGSNRYSFSATPLAKYKQLYQLILNYNALDPDAAADELRQLIEFHEQEIVNTGVDEIPELLDYRNWFHYELRVLTEDENGIVMDHRVKSIGSGGEQAVPNYLLILTIAHFLFDVQKIRLPILLLDEAFYGIDSQRRDQILGFASDLSLQLLVASPELDGARAEIPNSTTLLVVKDENYDVHLYDYIWEHQRQQDLLEENATEVEFGEELT